MGQGHRSVRIAQSVPTLGEVAQRATCPPAGSSPAAVGTVEHRRGHRAAPRHLRLRRHHGVGRGPRARSHAVGPVYARRRSTCRSSLRITVPSTRARPATTASSARRYRIVAISDHQAHCHGTPIAAVIHHGIDTDFLPVGDGRGGLRALPRTHEPRQGRPRRRPRRPRRGLPLKIAAKMARTGRAAYFDSCRPPARLGVEYVGEVGGDEKLGAARRRHRACSTPSLGPNRSAW